MIARSITQRSSILRSKKASQQRLALYSKTTEQRVRSVGLLHFQFSRLVRPARPHFSSAAITTTDITWLFVELTLAHFFLYTCMFDKFSESTNCFIHTFIITQTQLNHKNPPLGETVQLNRHGAIQCQNVTNYGRNANCQSPAFAIYGETRRRKMLEAGGPEFPGIPCSERLWGVSDVPDSFFTDQSVIDRFSL